MGLIQTLEAVQKAREPNAIVRGVTALAIAGKDKHAEHVAKGLWKDHASTIAVLRGAVAPTMTTDVAPLTLNKATASLFTAGTGRAQRRDRRPGRA